MSEPRLHSVTCASPAGLHRMAYWEWGEPDNDRVLLCVHGLTRTGRDFDALARRMAPHFRVVCPDVAGRGRSDRLREPAFYAVPQYVADMVTLLARLNPRQLAWVGTSMGGLVGMALGGSAALARRDPRPAPHRPGPALDDAGLRVDRMVINDVGPKMELAALGRIGLYVGQPLAFDSFEQAVAHTREVSAGFGPHTEAQWRELAAHTYVSDGRRWHKHYDLALARPFALPDPAGAVAGELLLWRCYEALDCPVLLVRGAESDLLSAATARQMLARNRRARLLEFAGVGHAPTFMQEDQLQAVSAFLLEP
ncbi:alpha/beta hydrolase [Orrella sp. JC864]|uniref:alpha/beta fold hydrolase n=1 Tax=Orrella sp. JC864 TaxID=3120298 RepID=UPI0012BD3251